MRTNDIGLEELDMLTSVNDLRSLDPEPAIDDHMDRRVLKDLISDHLNALKRLGSHLPRSADLNGALSALSNEYEKLLGRRLNELSESSPQVRSAVLELRRQLAARIKEESPDLSYMGIDMLMKRVCREHGCTPQSLHDAFVDTFLTTPDRWAKDQLGK